MGLSYAAGIILAVNRPNFIPGLWLHPLQRGVSYGFPGDDGPLAAQGPDLHDLRHLQLPHQHRVQRTLRLHSGKVSSVSAH